MPIAPFLVARALGITLAVTPLTPPTGEAETIAARTGDIIGAAAVCGVPDAELVALERKVIGWARDAARDADELRRAQTAHEAATRRGAARIERVGQGRCAETLRSFRELEQEER